MCPLFRGSFSIVFRVYLGGGAITLGKRGHFPSAEAQGGAVFPLNYIYFPQERWWASPYYQSEGPESLYTSSSLQDGGYTGPEGHSSPQRLHDKVGSKGCLPIDSNLSTPSEVSELHLEPSGLPVHMSPIRAIQCPPDLHKGHETCGGSPQVLGNQTGSVPGRHAVFSSVQVRADPVEEHYPGSLREPGLPDKLPQISSGAIPDHEILRILSEHNYYATLPPQGEGGPDSQRGSRSGSATARQLAHLIGLFTATLPAVLPAPLHYRGLQELKHAILRRGGLVHPYL